MHTDRLQASLDFFRSSLHLSYTRPPRLLRLLWYELKMNLSHFPLYNFLASIHGVLWWFFSFKNEIMFSVLAEVSQACIWTWLFIGSRSSLTITGSGNQQGSDETVLHRYWHRDMMYFAFFMFSVIVCDYWKLWYIAIFSDFIALLSYIDVLFWLQIVAELIECVLNKCCGTFRFSIFLRFFWTGELLLSRKIKR